MLGHNKSPGGLAISQKTLYLVTQENCANCPAAKAVVQEALEGSSVQLKTIDLQDMDPDLEFKLLEHQVFIASTPSIILEHNGSVRLLYSGTVPSVDEVRHHLELS